MKTSIGNHIIKPLIYAFLAIYTFISIYPLVWMVFYSFKNNDEIFVKNPFGFPAVLRVENYINAWKHYDIPLYFLNSIIVAAATVFFTITLSLMFSYATARMKWRFSNAARIYIMTGMFIPVQIILVPLVLLMRNFGLSNSLWSLIVPYTAFELGFSSVVFYGFLRNIPFELEEAAAIDGANIYTTFFRIIVPLVKPAIATMVTFIFLFSWNEFTMALILISKNSLKTLPLGLITFQGQFQTDWGGMGAAMVIASIPTILIYLLFNQEVEKALTVGSAIK
jgi:raffinose/stachyose/melibiose transport system permease protein